MFSELARGSCTWDGALKIEDNADLCYVEQVKRAASSQRQIRSSATSSVLLRKKSALTNSSWGLSESKQNELLLPKTYVTKTGHLLLFAVIDNELFALIDSSKKDDKKLPKRHLFGEKAELLSGFKSLEDFVLSVLEYSHEKEKHLYASANKRLFHYDYQKTPFRISEQSKVGTDIAYQENEKYVSKPIEADDQENEGSVLETRVTIGSSEKASVKEQQPSKETEEINFTSRREFDSLALPNSNLRTRGKLRSPLLERKSAVTPRGEETHQHEYFQLSIQLNQRQRSSENLNRLTRSRLHQNKSSIDQKSLEKEFLYSVRGYAKETRDGVVPTSVKNIIKTINENQQKYEEECKLLYLNEDNEKRTSSPLQSRSVLPFMYDGQKSEKRGHSAVVNSRQSSSYGKLERARSVSLQDLQNVNLHPRIASSKPVADKRALGVTPSAISLSSEEFARLLEINSANKLSLKLPIQDDLLNFEAFNSVMKSEGISREVTVSSETVIEMTKERHSASHFRSHLAQSSANVDPVLREGSYLSVSQANKIMGLDSDGNEILSDIRPASKSASSFLGDDDDDDDKILFSFITPSLRKGSWNPMTSFSFESSSEQVREGSFLENDNFARSDSDQREDAFVSDLDREVSALTQEGRLSVNAKGLFGSETALPNLTDKDTFQSHSGRQRITHNQLYTTLHQSQNLNTDSLNEILSVRSLSPRSVQGNGESEVDQNNNVNLEGATDQNQKEFAGKQSVRGCLSVNQFENGPNKKSSLLSTTVARDGKEYEQNLVRRHMIDKENRNHLLSTSKEPTEDFSLSAPIEHFNDIDYENTMISDPGDSKSAVPANQNQFPFSKESTSLISSITQENSDVNAIQKEVSFQDKNEPCSFQSNEMISVKSMQKENQDIDRQSSFISNTATNVSVRDSIPDDNLVEHTERIHSQTRSSHSLSGVSNRSDKSDGTMAWGNVTSNRDSDQLDNFIDSETVNANNALICDETIVNQLTIADNTLQEKVVVEGSNLSQNSEKMTNPISRTREHIYVENSVFGAKQLVKSKTHHVLSENHSNIGDHQKERLFVNGGKTESERAVTITQTAGVSNLPQSKSSEALAVGIKENSSKGEEASKFSVNKQGADENKRMPSLQKTAKKDENNKRTRKPGKQAGDKNEKQTMELKIDLKVAPDSSPDTGSAELEKPVHPEIKNDNIADISSKPELRLDGVGEGESKDDSKKLEELKVLLQQNKATEDPTKPKKKQPERTAPLKRAAVKQKKKRITSRQGSISKKGTDSKNLSPVLDLPKKMETVETMIGRPDRSENLMKPSPDTEPEAAIEREVTFENQLEIKESAASKNVRIQNVEVKKVADVEPEKKGAYPPSRTKRGKKSSKKVVAAKEQSEDKLKYEEQMRLLKEKEIEQQRAREAAMAKQRVLEEERERYKEEEEEAKKKEEEARKKLAEAKVKAKEEREAKRAADAEKRRQLVEQRREERRQKEIDLAEKEKEAERLKFERERRAQELKEQREKLKEQERREEEQLLERERLEELKREEEEKKREEEKIRKAQEELERLIEEREYREQLRRVAEAQEEKMREVEEQRRLEEEKEQQRITEERERIKRAEYLKLQAELERQKEAEAIADERRQMMLLKAAKRKAELLKRREENMERMFDLKCKRSSQGISRAFTFTYFVHIPRSVWELPIGWSNKKGKGGGRGKNRPISVAASMKSSK